MNIVIDVETTGLFAGIYEICQVGAVIFDNDLEPMDSFSSYVRPLKPKVFQAAAFAVNGLSMEFLKDKPLPATVRTAFTCWLEDASEGTPLTPLGHNYHFDKGFLSLFLGLDCYERLISYRHEDTCVAMRFLMRAGRVKAISGSLKAALEEFKITRKEPHDALSDCYATLELYKKLVRL